MRKIAKHKLADRYFELKAQLADLNSMKAELESMMLETGDTEFTGNHGRVVLTPIAPTLIFDGAKARQFLTKSQLEACRKTRKGSTRFTTNAHVKEAA